MKEIWKGPRNGIRKERREDFLRTQSTKANNGSNGSGGEHEENRKEWKATGENENKAGKGESNHPASLRDGCYLQIGNAACRKADWGWLRERMSHMWQMLVTSCNALLEGTWILQGWQHSEELHGAQQPWEQTGRKMNGRRGWIPWSQKGKKRRERRAAASAFYVFPASLHAWLLPHPKPGKGLEQMGTHTPSCRKQGCLPAPQSSCQHPCTLFPKQPLQHIIYSGSLESNLGQEKEPKW